MKKFKLGLQLYSVRDKMKENMEETLKAVKAMGYNCVEFAGYFGKSANEVRSLLDKYGLECASVHQTYDVFLDKPKENIEYLKTLGTKYCAIPWMGIENHKGHEGFEKAAEDITRTAKILKDAGIQMLYHNHNFEFEKYDGKYLIDWLYETIPSELLRPEFDTCWIKYAGEDPVKYLRKYKDYIDVVHLKDFISAGTGTGPVFELIDSDGNPIKPTNGSQNDFMYVPVGSGKQNFKEIISVCDEIGAEYLIVEQDNWYNADSLECAKKSIDYLKTILK